MDAWLPLGLVAVVLGVPFGLSAATAWETQVRRLPRPWMPFGSESILSVIVGMLFVKIPMAAALFFGPPYLALRLFDLFPLLIDGRDRLFMLAYMACIAIGKALRYAYWKWTYRGQLV